MNFLEKDLELKNLYYSYDHLKDFSRFSTK